MGAAAAMPAAVRCIAFPVTDNRDPDRYHPSWVSWLTHSLRRARGPSRSQLLPPVLLSVALSVTSLEALSLNLARAYALSMTVHRVVICYPGNIGVQRSSCLRVYQQCVCSVA